MRIKHLLENGPLPPKYYGVVTDNGDPNHWDDHSEEEVLVVAQQLESICLQHGYTFDNYGTSKGIDEFAATSRTIKLRKVIQSVVALSEDLYNAGVPTRVFIHKIENGVDTLLSQPDDDDGYDDYTGVDKLRNFLANNGSIESDLL